MATTRRQIERELALVRLQAAELSGAIAELGTADDDRLAAIGPQLQDLLARLEGLDAGLTVAQAAEQLNVSPPTVSKWISEKLLDAVPGRRPAEVTPQSVVRVARILDRVREVYPTRQWTKALAAYVHDQDLQAQDWFRKGLDSLSSGERVKV